MYPYAQKHAGSQPAYFAIPFKAEVQLFQHEHIWALNSLLGYVHAFLTVFSRSCGYELKYDPYFDQ